jgi:uncharacterized protein (UPF0261 family)
MLSCGPIQRKDEGDALWTSRNLAERKLLVQDALRVQARPSPDESRLIAKEVADKLNRHENKKLVKFVVPTQGFSSLSVEDGALYDPVSDRAFIDELRKALNPEIEIIEVETHINTPEFARAVVEVLRQALT